MVRNNKGYSFIEMLMVVTILGIISTVGPRLMIQVHKFFFLNSTRMDLQRDARVAMSIMSRSLRQAQSNTILLDQVAGQPYYSRIDFVRKDGPQIQYYQQGKQLRMTSGTTNSILSRNLRYLTFSTPRSDDMTIIGISMTFEKATFEGNIKALHMASEKVRIMNE